MKKLVLLNVVCNGSTGKIMCDLARSAINNNYDMSCIYGRESAQEGITSYRFNSKFDVYLHVILARLGFNGYGSYFATKKIVKFLKETNPDVIHLHNIHGYWINLKVLFKFLKNDYKGKILWTLHDCWSFTGHCSHFTSVGCNKWQRECHNCPILIDYPKEYFDTSKREYRLKKKLFTGLKNVTIVTPSDWLKRLAKKSFLKDYTIKVINNGIDLSIFKPSKDKSIYEKYNIPKEKKIILGVANVWNKRKGLNDFIELSQKINNKYQIVLVGIDKIDNSNIICVSRTSNQQDLASLYSIATVLFVPTYEDNYPTVILESVACNTPVLTYNTGGCVEAMHDHGYVVQKKNYSEIIDKIEKINKINTAVDKKEIDKDKMINEYINIYK